jgi:putative transposase
MYTRCQHAESTAPPPRRRHNLVTHFFVEVHRGVTFALRVYLELLEQQDGDVLREGIRVLSQALMETEVAGLIGAERHERTGERTAYRNGSRTRTWDTRMGTIELAIPKVTRGRISSSLL